jgi:hypothetical protein
VVGVSEDSVAISGWQPLATRAVQAKPARRKKSRRERLGWAARIFGFGYIA